MAWRLNRKIPRGSSRAAASFPRLRASEVQDSRAMERPRSKPGFPFGHPDRSSRHWLASGPRESSSPIVPAPAEGAVRAGTITKGVLSEVLDLASVALCSGICLSVIISVCKQVAYATGLMRRQNWASGIYLLARRPSRTSCLISRLPFHCSREICASAHLEGRAFLRL